MTSNGAAAAAQGSATAAAPAATELLELAAQRLLAGEACKATPSSNYDYVKVKIRLGSQLEHYYILSRFLLSRVLTVITLPQHKVRRRANMWHACSRVNEHHVLRRSCCRCNAHSCCTLACTPLDLPPLPWLPSPGCAHCA